MTTTTEPLYLKDIVRQWLQDDPDLSHWSLESTNRLWFACTCHPDTTPHLASQGGPNQYRYPYCCMWADCVQVILPNYNGYDIKPQDPDFFAKLKTVLINRCK